MFVTSPKIKNGKTVVRLVHSIRKKGSKYSTPKIIKVVGQSDDPDIIRKLKSEAESMASQYNNGLIKLDKIKESKLVDVYRFMGYRKYNKGFWDILGSSYDRLKFHQLLTSGKDNVFLNDIMKYTVLMRIIDPCSKLRTCSLIKEYFHREFSYKQILDMMDHIAENEDQLRTKIFNTALNDRKDLELVLFDVTTLYFESIKLDDLRDFGFSKDGKFGETQIVLAVLSDKDGIPLSYEVFPGNTAETTTFSDLLEKFVKKHPIKKFKITADRGMFSEKNINILKLIGDKYKIESEYVISCPLKKTSKNLQEELFKFKQRITNNKATTQDDPQSTTENNDNTLTTNKDKPFSSFFHETTYKNRRLIIVYSEEAASRDEKKRQKLIDKIQAMVNDKNEISSDSLHKKTGIKRYFKKTSKNEMLIFDEDRVAFDKCWDGLYGLCTNDESQPAQEVFNNYRRLWKIEELFRINKHNLSMRPIYHWVGRRIKTHILLCFLAYCTLKNAEFILKKNNIILSHQTLIDELNNAVLFTAKHKTKGLSCVLCFPVELSKKAQNIYNAFNIKFPVRTFEADYTK